MMLSLPAEINARCSQLFLRCDQFASQASLRALFVTPEISPFRACGMALGAAACGGMLGVAASKDWVAAPAWGWSDSHSRPPCSPRRR